MDFNRGIRGLMRVLEVFVIFSMVMVSLIQAYVESIKLCYTYM